MRPLTLTDVARRPFPGTTAPTQLRFSHDGTWLSYLVAEPGSLRQRLEAIEVGTGRRVEVPPPGAEVDEASIGLEEQLRRERARELAVGVTRYHWAAAAGVLLVPMGDGIWVLDGPEGAPRLVVGAGEVPGPILDAQVSADGSTIGFVSAEEVYVVDAGGQVGPVAVPPVQVTHGARGTGRTNGLAEYIAQEEMGRPYGFWLSPGGTRVAFTEVTDTHIPVFRIVHQGADRVGESAQEDHRYPFAGADNARVRLGIAATGRHDADDRADDRADGTDVRWLDLGATGIEDDRYLARVDWIDEEALLVQVQDRRQCRLDLVRFDVSTGAATLVLSETSDVWVNLHDHLRIRPDGSFLWGTERSGFMRLEHRDPDGTIRSTVAAPSPDAVVTVVHAVDDEWVWFGATGPTARERHVYRAPLDGSGVPERLTRSPGTHTATIHAATGTWVDSVSSTSAPPAAHLRLFRNDEVGTLVHDAARDQRVAELGLAPPLLDTIRAGDGSELHRAVFAPDPDRHGTGPHPTVVQVYGGPHAQLVTDSWGLTVAMRAQYLRQQGYCVAIVDNRGSANRGLAFEGSLRRRMGTVEVEDQVALVASLVDEGMADPDRVGMYGWSYGGYMAAMCLAQRPDVFRSACAGAPVTSWDGYDTHYTERYMGTPADNPDGYAQGSVMTHVDGLAGRDLLLVHGLIDENVHFRHTARLLNALIKAESEGRTCRHRLLLYPDERHVPRSETDRITMEQRIVAFFNETLAR